MPFRVSCIKCLYMRNKQENPLQTGQSGYANIEFWAWGWFGPYMIEQHTTELLTSESQKIHG